MFDLSSYNSFHLPVFCEEGREIFSLEDLQKPINPPYIILGGGSDVLFTEDFAGTVLINKIVGYTITKESDKITKVRVGGGYILDQLIIELLNHNITGLENLSLIPGTIGAAPIQNIGAYGVEIGDFIDSIEAYNLKTQEFKIFTQAECQFSYRHSYFKEHKNEPWFITHVNLVFANEFLPKLTYSGLQSLEFKDAFAIRNRVISLRNEKLPNPDYVGNAGSFFKNPYIDKFKAQQLQKEYEQVPLYPIEDNLFKVAAGWLIDKAGCRGIKHGQAGTWGNQALVIVNLGKAKPHEIVAMAHYVCSQVKMKFDIDLVPEVRLYGKHGEVEWEQI